MGTPQAPTGAAITKEIGGVTYGTRHMNPETLLLHAGRVFGLSASAMLSKSGTDSGLMTVLRDCFELAMADGRELRGEGWKIHFLGKPKDLVQVVGWMLEVHFADFFEEAVNVASGYRERFGALLGFKASTPQ